jgi:hypothetical protein
MDRINIAFLAMQVGTDPAVLKAAQQAWNDIAHARNDIVLASESVGALIHETRSAWQRTRGAGGTLSPTLA